MTVGIIDDITDMKAIIKLLCQIIAAAIVVYSGVRIEMFANPFARWFGGPPYIFMNYWVSVAVTMFWITGICNAVNLIDGLDGLAVGVSSIASICMLVMTMLSQNINVAIITAAVAGAGFGFLPYNFNPAKIFMGDTGALFLGFILACISIQGFLKLSAIISFAVPIIVLGLPIFDTLFAIIRRVLTGRSPMSPDRGHLHHRLLDMGFSQKQTVAILYTITAVLCLTALVFELCHTRKLSHICVTVQHPRQLNVCRDVRLKEHGAFLRVNACGKKQSKQIDCVFSEYLCFLANGNCVQIRKHKITFILIRFLQLNPVAQCSDVISERYRARWLNTAQYSLFWCNII